MNKPQKAKATGGGPVAVAGDSATECALHVYSTRSPPICQHSPVEETNTARFSDDLARLLTQAIRLGCRYPGDWRHAATRKALPRRRGMGT
jgi:hypothetical protein